MSKNGHDKHSDDVRAVAGSRIELPGRLESRVAAEGDSGQQCGTCRHWHKLPVNPANLLEPVRGECRAVPPATTMVFTQSGQLAGKASGYPSLVGDFPACGMYDDAAPIQTETPKEST